jgi:hypothetical protein
LQKRDSKHKLEVTLSTKEEFYQRKRMANINIYESTEINRALGYFVQNLSKKKNKEEEDKEEPTLYICEESSSAPSDVSFESNTQPNQVLEFV